MIPPCQADPISFDVDPDNGTPHPPINQLVHACLTRCPAFEWCKTQDHSDVYGVVAGSYKPHPLAELTVIRNPSVRKAADYLASVIATLNPGDEIPSQREVCEATGINRAAVRTAIGLLAAAGAIAPGSSTGRGTRYVVAEPSPDQDAPVLAGAAA